MTVMVSSIIFQMLMNVMMTHVPQMRIVITLLDPTPVPVQQTSVEVLATASVSTIIKRTYHCNQHFIQTFDTFPAPKAYIPLRRKTTLLHYPTQKIPTCWYLFGDANFLCHPTQNPQRESVEYRLRWDPNAKFLRWACTFNFFGVDFICVWRPTQTQFPVEYRL